MTRITNTLTGLREKAAKREEGFTLIELLVVVLIIGILAAIAIPVYIGIQNSTKESATQSDVQNLKTAIVAYFTAEGTYPSADTDLSTFGYPGSSQPDDSTISFTINEDDTFCVTGISPTTKTFYASDSSGVVDGTVEADIPASCTP